MQGAAGSSSRQGGDLLELCLLCLLCLMRLKFSVELDSVRDHIRQQLDPRIGPRNFRVRADPPQQIRALFGRQNPVNQFPNLLFCLRVAAHGNTC